MKISMHFGLNDWFILVSALLVWTAYIMLRGTFSSWHAAILWTYNFYLAAAVDHVLAGTQYDLYDIMDDPKFELMDLFLYLFVYAPTAVLYMKIYDLLPKRTSKGVLFLLGCVTATLALEWIALQVNVFVYRGWSIGWSALVYSFVYSTNLVLHRMLHRHRASQA